MRLTEFESDTTVCLFRGLETTGVEGNAQLEQLAQAVGGRTFKGTDVDGARVYLAQRPNTKLILVGYSKGAEGVRDMQGSNPVLSITIAGYPTTLENMRVAGVWYNFYDPTELNGLMRGPRIQANRDYIPGSGNNIPVKALHTAIVGQVSSQVISLIKGQGTSGFNKITEPKPHWGDKYKESQGRGKNL